MPSAPSSPTPSLDRLANVAIALSTALGAAVISFVLVWWLTEWPEFAEVPEGTALAGNFCWVCWRVVGMFEETEADARMLLSCGVVSASLVEFKIGIFFYQVFIFIFSKLKYSVHYYLLKTIKYNTHFYLLKTINYSVHLYLLKTIKYKTETLLLLEDMW